MTRRADQVRADGGVVDSGSIGQFGFVLTPRRLILVLAVSLPPLQACDKRRVCELHANGMTIRDLAVRYGVARSAIQPIVAHQPSKQSRAALKLKAGTRFPRKILSVPSL